MTNSATNEVRRSRFSQATIDVTEVQQEVMSIREALGKPIDVHRFLVKALQANNIQPSINLMILLLNSRPNQHLANCLILFK